MYNSVLNASYIENTKQFVRGNVAIVGNGSSLMMDSKGSEIDSHDCVIRFGKGVPDKFNAPHIGSKTDIWCFTSFRADIGLWRAMNPRAAFYSLAQISLYKSSMLTIPNCFVDGSMQVYSDFGVLGSRKEQLDWVKSIYKDGFDKVRPSQGLIFMQFFRRYLMNKEVKNVDIYGFDFFESQFVMNGKPSASWHCPILRDNAKEVPHDSKAERTFFENLMRKDQRYRLISSPNITQERGQELVRNYRGAKL